MMKSTAQAEQFYTRSGSQSTKGSRKGFSLLGGGEDVLAQLTPDQQRASLVACLDGLRDELNTAKLQQDPVRVKHISVQIAQVELMLRQRFPKQRKFDSETFPDFFMEVCREMMTKPQYKAIVDEAKRRQLAAEGKE